MSKLEKLKSRIRTEPKDFTYKEAKTLLGGLGFVEFSKGKTSGSRVKFYREADGKVILLHKPHPGDIMSPGAVNDLKTYLEEYGEI